MNINNSFQNRKLSDFAAAIQPVLLKIELAAGSVILLGFVLRLQSQALASLLFQLGLVTLAISYYILAFRKQEANVPMSVRFAYRLAGVGQATSLLSILWNLLSYPGNKIMAVAGGMLLCVAGFLFVGMRNLKKIDRKETRGDMLRVVFVLIALFTQFYAKAI